MNDAGFEKQYGPWALVAGASKGLGAAFASQLAGRGLNLVLVARSAEGLAALSAQLTGQYRVSVRTLTLDLSDPGAASAIAGETADLDIGLLVYNAAYSAIGPFFDIPFQDHLREIETNCRAPLSLAYLIGRRMVPRGRGGIILMSSLSAAQGSALISNYAATKAYNVVLAEGIWEELRRQGIDVLVSCPAAVATPNYQNSTQANGDRSSVSAMPPEAVARETLSSLGRRPLIVPGRANRMAAFFMQRLLPRSAAVRLMGRVLRGMYG